MDCAILLDQNNAIWIQNLDCHDVFSFCAGSSVSIEEACIHDSGPFD